MRFGAVSLSVALLMGAMVGSSTEAPAMASAASRSAPLAYEFLDGCTDESFCTSHIELIDSNGRHRRRLPCASSRSKPRFCTDIRPAFSWDHKRLATTTGDRVGAAPAFVWIRTSSGRILDRFPTRIETSGLAWSPHRRQMAVATSSGVFIHDLGTGRDRSLNRTETDGVSWSRQGRLAWDDGRVWGDILIAAAPGRRARRLHVRGDSPKWSPDGRRLLFECLEGACLANVDGSGRRILSRGCETTEGGLAWSPDGREVACQGKDGILVVVSVSSRHTRLINRRVWVGKLAW